MVEQDLIQEYLNGKSISQLSKETEYTYYSIQKILRKNNIVIRGGRKKKELTPAQLEELRYLLEKENKFMFEVQNIFNLDSNTLRRICEENNIQRPNLNRINKNLKEDYFAMIDSHEKAYWLGFLFTDGSVDQYKGHGRIRLQLQEQDLEILKKFKEDLNIKSQIIYDKRVNSTCCSVEFMSKKMFNDLAKYGIVPQKTYKTKHLPYNLIPQEFLYSFILGLFDGDGCLTYSANFSTDVTFGFTSYYESIAKEFQYLIDNYILNKQQSNKIIFTSAWHVNWRGRLQVLQILDKLYECCPRHLQRKYDKYLALKNSLS